MADDINKSKMPPMNGGFGLSEIEKIGATAYSIPKSEQELRERASRSRTQIESLSDLPDNIIANSKTLSRLMSTAPNTLMSAEARIRSSMSSRLERSNIQAANVVGREYSETAINSRVRDMYESPSFQNQALSMMNVPYESLAAKRAGLSGQISALGSQSAEAAGNLFTNRGMRRDLVNTMSGNATQASTLVQEMASIDLAMKTRRQTGLDPLSKFEKLNATGTAASDFLSAKSIGEEISRGGVSINQGGKPMQVANADIGKALAQEADNLKKALSDLANSAGKSAEELEKMRKGAEESAENFEKLQKAQTGGGGGNNIAKFNYYGGAFASVAEGSQQMLIGQRMQEMSNISGYAGLANQQYDQYKAARSGNLAAAMSLINLEGAEKTGSELYRDTNITNAIRATGLGFDFAAGTALAGESSLQKGNPLSYGMGISTQNTTSLLAGTNQALSAATGLGVLANDVDRSLSSNAAKIAGIQAHNQAVSAINNVGVTQAQGLRNFYTDSDIVAQGLGTGANAFISAGDANLEAARNARMSPDQWLAAASQGVNSMGSTFDIGGSQITAARNLEARGFGSVDQNMKRMGTLAGAGANNPLASIETALTAAVASGLDRSKGLDTLIQNTAAMAEGTISKALGIDTTGASTAMLVAGMASMKDNPNRENALQTAASAQDVLRRNTTNQDVSFIGMANTGILADKLSKSGIDIAGKGSMAAAISGLQGINLQDLKTWKSMTPGKAAELLQNQGINATESNAKQIIDIRLKEAEAQATRQGETTLGISHEEVLRLRAKKNKTGEDIALLGQVQKFSGQVSGNVGELAVGTIAAPNTLPTKGQTGAIDKDDAKTRTDKARTSGDLQLSEAATAAAIKLGGFTKAMDTFMAIQTKFEKGGVGNEKEYEVSAAKMAKDFTGVARDFGKSSDKLSVASDALLKAAGLINRPGTFTLPSFNTTLDQPKGK